MSEKQRSIKVPVEVLRMWADNPTRLGRALEFTAHVNWPELALTDEERFANAAARADGEPEPYVDLQYIRVILPYPGE